MSRLNGNDKVQSTITNAEEPDAGVRRTSHGTVNDPDTISCSGDNTTEVDGNVGDEESQAVLPAGDFGAPPDGGLEAWTQVLMSHLINFNTFGYMLSYGIFQGYYTDNAGYSASNVSWVGTVELFFVYFVGIFSGRALDTGYYRHTLFCGLTLQVFGAFMTSISTKYWQLFLAQGICQGIGNGLLFCPAIAVVSTYFSSRKRAVAVSLVACGGGTGGMVFPAVAQTLLDKIGFAWTVRVMAFIMLFNAIVVLTFSRTRIPPRKMGAFVDWEAFREWPFVLFCIGIFLAFWGLYFGYYYVRPFSRDILHVSQYSSFSLLLIVNGLGIPGRITPALLSDRYVGPVNMIVPFTLITGILILCWMRVDSSPGLYVWAAVYGFFAGGVQSLFQAASSSFTSDLQKVGTRIGMVFTLVSVACLTGSPIAGILIEADGGQYPKAQIFGGTVIICGSVLLLTARLAVTGANVMVRV